MSYKEFKTDDEVTKFIETYYGNFANTHFTKSEIANVLSVQSSAKTDYEYLHSNSTWLPRVFNDVLNCFNNIPAVPFDIVAFRSGDMLLKSGANKRTFYSASLLKTVVDEKYATKEKPTTLLYIKRGTKIIPLQALDKQYGGGDAEIILLVENVAKRDLLFNKYIYHN